MSAGGSVQQLRLAFVTNEPRARYLLEALRGMVGHVEPIGFDDIDPLTKAAAAALSVSWPRVEWYRTYQMHPLVQARRRRVMQGNLARLPAPVDALLMWGSWFHPWGRSVTGLPYVNYIDQSRSIQPVHGEPATSPAGRRRSHGLQARTYRDSSGVLCMASWCQEQTRRAHPSLPPERVQVVGWGPCGVDLSREDLADAPREPLVLHVSNDFRRKGVDFLAETAARVRRVRPDVRFVVIGRDSTGLDVRRMGEVEFVGQVSDRQVLADYFRRAAVFFLPHRFDRAGHVLAEAMSASVPMVVSAQGGPLEVVEGRGTGHAVPVGDIDGYTRALLSLLGDEPSRRAMGRRARDLMLDWYNWPGVARRILAVVESAVARRRGQPAQPR